MRRDSPRPVALSALTRGAIAQQQVRTGAATAEVATKPNLTDSNTWTQPQTFDSIPVLASGGISFPAAQVPSADANTLDDYEEGTFTPGLTFGGASVGMTFNVANTSGKFTKVGRVVFYVVRLILTAKGSSTGVAAIPGLPFAAATGVSYAASIVPFNMASLNTPLALVASASSSVAPYNFNGTTSAQMTDANFTNTSILNISGSYSV